MANVVNIKKVICPICENLDHTIYCYGRDRLHAISGEFKSIKCSNCGLLSIYPKISKKLLARYYPTDYHAYLEYNPGATQEKFAIYLFDLYFGKQPIWKLPLKLIFLPFRHLLRGTLVQKNKTILDLGCGNGAFLYKMKMLGMKTYGLEYSNEGAKAAQHIGLNVECGTLESKKYPPNFFDVITLNHVFEHVDNPKETLNELKRILKKDGRIIMAMPNSRSFAAKIFGTYWASLDIPRHLMVHCPKTIRLLAEKNGLKVKNVRYISFPFQFQASLSYVLNKDKKIPLDKTFLGESRFFYWLFFPLVYIVDILHCGDVIEVTLEKAKSNDKKILRHIQADRFFLLHNIHISGIESSVDLSFDKNSKHQRMGYICNNLQHCRLPFSIF